MKTLFGIVLTLWLGSTGLLWAQPDQSGQTAVPPPTSPVFAAQDANSRVCQWTEYGQSPSGVIVTNVHTYTELATGLNHLVNGQWVESSETIQVLPNGTAAATNGQHQAYFPGDIYNGVIKLVTPDGLQLVSQPVGLAYFDGTNTVMIATLTNSFGTVVGNNQVVYTNAFNGLAADLQYTYTLAGFEQDVILRQQPPTPESLGLNANTAVLEMFTGFSNPPPPTITSSALPTQAGLSLTDQKLTFGAMYMTRGRAFLLGTNGAPRVFVSKQWVTVEGQPYLVEQVPVNAIAAELAALPLTALNDSPGRARKYLVSKQLVLPKHSLKPNPKPARLKLAKAIPVKPGLTLDYVTINGTNSNYTFQGDTTYYISHDVTITGTATLEGGTVIKLNDAGIGFAGIVLDGSPVNCQTGPYLPAIFTDKNDNSVGDTISGSTGNPTNDCTIAIAANTSAFGDLEYIHFRYCGLEDLAGSSTIRNCQFVNLMNGGVALYIFGGTPDNLENDLFSHMDFVFQGSSGLSVTATNLTVDCVEILTDFTDLTAYNSVFCNVTNLVADSATISGSYNGFYNTYTFGSSTVTSSSYPFKSVLAGNYYLTNGCVFHSAGTTNIDRTLQAILQSKTTYSPIVYTNLTVSGTWTLQVQRDTVASAPDLGYHYDPIDYEVSGITPNGLTLTNGVTVAAFYSYGGFEDLTNDQGGFDGLNGAGFLGTNTFQLTTVGTAQQHNHICSFQDVQEQPITLGYSESVCELCAETLALGGLEGRFTDFDGLPGVDSEVLVCTGIIFFDADYVNLTLRDCRIGPGEVYCYLGVEVGTNQCINNVFERATVAFNNQMFNTFSEDDMLLFYNNLVRNSTLQFIKNACTNPTPWYVRDNLFDSNSISYSDSTGLFTYDHNGYLHTAQLTPAGSGDQVLTSFTYTNGPLGNYYQFSPNLLNQGYTNANLLGLYHYTVQTTNSAGLEIPEGTNMVSIGFHYVATDTNGVPLDSNGDGIPDYIEDANGNGVVDSGEIGWNITGDLGLQVIITKPRNNSTPP